MQPRPRTPSESDGVRVMPGVESGTRNALIAAAVRRGSVDGKHDGDVGDLGVGDPDLACRDST